MTKAKRENNSLYRSIFKTLFRPRRIANKFLAVLSRMALLHPKMRVFFLRAMGVKFDDPGSVFIGSDVYFDELHPELIWIGKNVIITEGVRILSHFYDTSHAPHRFYVGNITIEEDVFIGMNAVFTHAVTVGKNSVIGTNSVVSTDIPPYTIACGSPCKIVTDRII